MIHIVNKFEIELECSTEEQAFELRKTFSSSGHAQLAGIIDNVCSKYVPENEWIRIDKLEFDLGGFSLNSFEQEFSKAFLSKFERIITEKISGIPKERLGISSKNSELELLEFFILKGYLPWWCDENSLDPDEISRNVFKNSRDEITDFYIRNYNNKTVWERSSYQLKNDVLAVLVQLFEELRKSKDILDSIFELIKAGVSLFEDSKKILIINELDQIRERSSNIIVLNAVKIFTASKDILEIKSVLSRLVLDELDSLKNFPDVQNDVVEKLLKYQKDMTISKGDSLSNEAVSITNKSVSDPPVDGKISIDPGSSSEIFNNEELTEEKLIIRHAGIILLAPFLKMFYDKLGLLADSSWINKDAQLKGLFLLKYLSSGIANAYEYQLILEKLLCGIALEEPVPSEIVLNGNEIEESELLLKSVIEHWKALKNSSVNGLRETFLKRDGIITKSDSAWMLQVERKTVDVLLESIPWGFSTTRLPWNDYLILTEW